MSYPWPREIKEAALEDYKRGMSVDEIDKKYGLKEGRLWIWRKEAKIKTRHPHLTPDQRRWISIAYSSGENHKAIARRYGIHVTSIRRVAVKYGAKIRMRGYPPEKVKKAIAEYLAGVPIKLIYFHCGVTRSTFYKYLDDYKVPKRKITISEAKRRQNGRETEKTIQSNSTEFKKASSGGLPQHPITSQ